MTMTMTMTIPYSAAVTATVAQSSRSQSPVFYQISPTEPLALRLSREGADNWKLWKEKYNNYFFISRLHRESPPYQLAMFKRTIGDGALKLIKTPKARIRTIGAW